MTKYQISQALARKINCTVLDMDASGIFVCIVFAYNPAAVFKSFTVWNHAAAAAAAAAHSVQAVCAFYYHTLGAHKCKANGNLATYILLFRKFMVSQRQATKSTGGIWWRDSYELSSSGSKWTTEGIDAGDDTHLEIKLEYRKEKFSTLLHWTLWLSSSFSGFYPYWSVSRIK